MAGGGVGGGVYEDVCYGVEELRLDASVYVLQ